MFGFVRSIVALAAVSTVLTWLPSQAQAAFALTLEAETMPVKTAGGTSGGVHNLWSNGYVEQSVNFPDSGEYLFEVRAQGTVAAGVSAKFELRIDGALQASVMTSGGAMAVYPIKRTISAGSHRVAVAFVNDYRTRSQDRNLLVDKIMISEVASSPPPQSPGSPSVEGVPNAPTTIQAEEMETQSTGGSYNGIHNLWSNGYVENRVNFPTSGTYQITVAAQGQLAGGVGPNMEIRIDGARVGGQNNLNGSMNNYPFKAVVAAGVHKVAIAFTNDTIINGEDRNLLVDKVSVAAGSDSVPVPTPTPSRSPASEPTPVPSTPAPATPTPAPVNGVARPFGSHPMTYASGTIKPSVSQSSMDQAVRASYDLWKSRYIAQMCGSGRYVVKGGQPNKLAVSEGQGYGMLITVMMAGYDPQARTIFDGIHRFTRDHQSNYANMMDWVINNDCSSGGDWPAVDGDLDMAMALLMAHVQWGSNGSINYLDEAKKTINAIKANIVKSNVIAGGPAADLARTSDFMFAHFRAFQKYTGDSTWGAVLTKTQSLIEQISSAYAPNTGLQPDFIENANTNSPRPITISRWPESDLVDWYSYNACRNPWRFGTDVVVSGDARSKAITQKMMNFFRSASGGNIHNIKAVYKLDGSIVQSYENMSFQAPIGVGAMVDSSNQAYLNNIWSFMASNTAGGYYDHSIQLISMMVMSGNWWQP